VLPEEPLQLVDLALTEKSADIGWYLDRLIGYAQSTERNMPLSTLLILGRMNGAAPSLDGPTAPMALLMPGFIENIDLEIFSESKVASVVAEAGLLPLTSGVKGGVHFSGLTLGLYYGLIADLIKFRELHPKLFSRAASGFVSAETLSALHAIAQKPLEGIINSSEAMALINKLRSLKNSEKPKPPYFER
jgi:hypothetical protein